MTKTNAARSIEHRLCCAVLTKRTEYMSGELDEEDIRCSLQLHHAGYHAGKDEDGRRYYWPDVDNVSNRDVSIGGKP